MVYLGLPIKNGGIFHGKLLVITRWYTFTSLAPGSSGAVEAPRPATREAARVEGMAASDIDEMLSIMCFPSPVWGLGIKDTIYLENSQFFRFSSFALDLLWPTTNGGS